MTDFYAERVPLKPIRFRASDDKPQSAGRVVKPGFAYRDAAASSFFSAIVTVPTEWAGERVGLHIVITGGEPLLFVDGAAYQALDYNHADVLLHAVATGGETHELFIEVYARTVGVDITLKSADLVRIDRDAYAKSFDFAIKAQLGRLSEEGAKPVDGLRVVCAGHSHLDLAYLWALPNTRKKVGRTWASALRLMDEYPDFRFVQSQPFLYDVCRTDYPDLWERVKARVAEGRWEPTGAMWVEADAHIPGGESLVRQLLHGQTFYKREFGAASKIAWLPDTFGFPASLPQLLQSAGVPYFLTSKLSWNDTNRFPHDTFRWRGTDGSEVLTHSLTAPDYHEQLRRTVSTYNSTTGIEQLRGAVARYRQANVHDEILYCVGYGDGGGGATREMAEMVTRFANTPGVPACEWGRADGFFDRLFARREAFPMWRGELYLENHRGTLTSQGWIKRANRQSETLLRNAEVFSVLAEVEAGIPYPAEELDALWKTLLTNQFHDILGGTVIAEAVADARADFARIEETGNRLLQTAFGAIAGRIAVREDTFVVFNPSDILRPTDAVRVTVPATVVKALEFGDDSGAILPSQFLSVDKKGNRDYLVLLTNIGAMGYQTIGAFKASGAAEETTVTAETEGDGAVLENEFVRVSLNRHGEVTSFVHKLSDGDDEDTGAVREREVIAPGKRGNALAVYADAPASYDTWNIEAGAFDVRTDCGESATVESFAVIENGAVRAGVEVVRRFRNSTLTQRLFLYAHSPRLEVQTVADWHEHQTLLCVHFPVVVHAGYATYEIAHGVIERPTHTNTPREQAAFEVAHHRFMDISEGDYGVSLLNDCKYGGCVRENDLRLTLIKSGIYPDPEADQGLHTFTYALLPHTGDYRAETVDEAHALNYPLLSAFVRKSDRRESPALPPDYALATVDDQGIVIDAVKKAKNGDGYIVRLYETFNTRGMATLSLGFDVAEAFACNVLEENDAPIAVSGGGDIRFDYRPFEIKTFRVVPA